MSDQQPNSAEARQPDGTLVSQAPSAMELLKASEAQQKPKIESAGEEGAKPGPEATETKADTKQPDAKKPEGSLLDGEREPEGAPEKYEDFKLPDGYELDEKVAAEATKLFKDLNLPQAGAQQLIDFYVKQTSEAFDQPYQAMLEMRAGWKKDVLSDTKLADGSSLKPEVKSAISKTIDLLGPAPAKAFREAMSYTGAGDHPAVVNGLYALAQRLTEGTHVKGNGPSEHGQRGPNAVSGPGPRALFPNNA